MAEQQDQDRTEQATPYKREKAREKGMVVRSTEVGSAFAVLAFLLFLYLWGGAAVRQLAAASARLLGSADALPAGPSGAWRWIAAAGFEALSAIGPLLAAVVIAAIAASVLQFGLVLTTQPLKPDWQRINPAAGFKRLFSRRALFDALKNVLKLALFGAVIWFTLMGLMRPLRALLFADARGWGPHLTDALGTVVFRLLLAMVAVALVDLVFANREYARKLMMSRRELRDEHKHREGDPKIKARIRELQAEMRRRSRSLRRAGEADVVLTNPTHVAVALLYRHGEMAAPQIVAKGAGEMAQAMKKLARRRGVAIVENRALARALYEEPLDAAVPEAWYPQVARIMVWVQEARRMRAARSETT
ncbi:MAG: EscU/YscU/HrcU family type III secretion system export apparatus switch protein [Aquabacterium sp.]|jgi:flagellar biosynthetic protein FlhB|nr:MAG: EscU/YscU/HrcU family type III secretion system export apparatus switch protein [Aquabacterium sp.]